MAATTPTSLRIRATKAARAAAAPLQSSTQPTTYTVTLNADDGTINAGNITSYTYGVGATLPTDVTNRLHFPRLV